MLRYLFRRVRDRVALRQCRRFERPRIRKAQLAGIGSERLEQRLAMAVNVFDAPAAAGQERWVSVVATEGSDVYLQHVANPDGDLFIADNSSFLSRAAEIAGFNQDYDELLVAQGVVEEGVDLQWVGYPYGSAEAADDGELAFLVPSEEIDTDQPLQATLLVGNTEHELTYNPGNNGQFFTAPTILGDIPFTVAPGTYVQVLRLSHPDFTGLTASDPVRLEDLVFDRAIEGNVQAQTTLPRLPVSSGSVSRRSITTLEQGDEGGTIQWQESARIQIADFVSDSQTYLPGTLVGKISAAGADFGDSNFGLFPVDFRIDTTDALSSGSGGADPLRNWVPVSFGGNRDRSVSFQQDYYEQRLTTTNRVAIRSQADVTIAGYFNVGTGELSLSAVIEERGTVGQNPRAIPLSAKLDEVRFAAFDNTVSQASDVVLFGGLNHEAGLTIDLAAGFSTIQIDSPVLTVAGAFGNGEVSLAATTIDVRAPIRAEESFVVPLGITERIAIDAPISAAEASIQVRDNQDTSVPSRSQVVVGRTGSVSQLADVLVSPVGPLPPADLIFVEAIEGDILIDGTMAATNQTYVIASPEDSETEAPYLLATDATTGAAYGRIEGETLVVTLGNDTFGAGRFNSIAGSVVSLDTAVDRIRVRAGSRGGDVLAQPFRYDLTVREQDALLIDGVVATSERIDISNGHAGQPATLDLLASLASAGDISLRATSDFTVSAPISTSFGQIELTAPAIDVRSSVRVYDTIPDERTTDIRIEATDGDLLMGNVVGGINRVELQAAGGILGDGRVDADTAQLRAGTEIESFTAARRVEAALVGGQAPGGGSITIDESDWASFEVKAAATVSLTARGTDLAIDGDLDPATGVGGKETVSPALFADVYDAELITVSAPNGGIDLLHYGGGEVRFGRAFTPAFTVTNAQFDPLFRDFFYVELTPEVAPRLRAGLRVSGVGIGAGTTITEVTLDDVQFPGLALVELSQPVQADLTPGQLLTISDVTAATAMRAAGSVVIRSNLAETMSVYDAPTAGSGAATARFATTMAVPGVNGEYPVYTENVPGDRPATLEFTLPADAAKVLFDDAEGLDIRATDRVFIKDGMEVSDGQGNVTIDNRVNGIYQVARKRFSGPEGDVQVEFRLVRPSSFDESTELAARHYVRITDTGKPQDGGGLAGKLFVSDGFDVVTPGDREVDGSRRELDDYSPIRATAVAARSGFTAVRAATVVSLDAEYERPIVDDPQTSGVDESHFGRITAASRRAITGSQDFAAFGQVALEEGDLVLVSFGTTIDNDDRVNGVYQVIEVGDDPNQFGIGGENWVLERYQGIDEDGDGGVDEAFTGLVAVNDGLIRTSLTGEMYELAYDPINQAALRYRELLNVADVNAAYTDSFGKGGLATFDVVAFDPATRDEITVRGPAALIRGLAVGQPIAGEGVVAGTTITKSDPVSAAGVSPAIVKLTLSQDIRNFVTLGLGDEVEVTLKQQPATSGGVVSGKATVDLVLDPTTAAGLAPGLAVTGGGLGAGVVIDAVEDLAGNDGKRAVTLTLTTAEELTGTSIEISPNFDPWYHYQTNLGSDNPEATVELTVSATEGTNNDRGTLGRMMTLAQDNVSVVDRTGDPQKTTLGFAQEIQLGGLTTISLTQALPEIVRPLTIDAGGRFAIDGSDISFNQDGGELRQLTGPARRFGPIRPSQVTEARRLTRGRSQETAAGDAVNGFVVRPEAAGTIIRNIQIGGFTDAAAISIEGAGNVLLDSVTTGGIANGSRLSNRYGIQVTAYGRADGVTIKASNVYDSTASAFGEPGVGIMLEGGVKGVRILETEVGEPGQGNDIGIQVRKAATDGSGQVLLGVADILPAQRVTAQLSGFGQTYTVDANDVDRRTITIPQTLETELLFGRLVDNSTPDGDLKNGQFRAKDLTFENEDRRDLEVSNVVADPDNPIYRVTLKNPLAENVAAEIELVAKAGYGDKPAIQPLVKLPSTFWDSGVRAGQQIYDEENGNLWEIVDFPKPVERNDAGEVVTKDAAVARVRLLEGPGGAVAPGESQPVEIGHFANFTFFGDRVRLPQSVDPRNLYLGQTVRSTDSTLIPSGTTIKAIHVGEAADGGRTVEIELAFTDARRRIQGTKKSGLLFGQALRRNVVQNNQDGVVLQGAAVRIVQTDIVDNIYDGVRVEGVDAGFGEFQFAGILTAGSDTVTGVRPADLLVLKPGMPVEGTGIPPKTTIVAVDRVAETITLSQAATASGAGANLTAIRPVIEIGGIGGDQLRAISQLDRDNAVIHSNGLAGVAFAYEFADFPDQSQDAEHPELPNFLGMFKMLGNYIGTDVSQRSDLANGTDGVANVVVRATTANAQNFSRNLLIDRDDDGTPRFDDDGSPITPERYSAPFRPEDNPEQEEALEDIEGLDLNSNLHGTGLGGSGGGYGDGGGVRLPPRR